ncbi:MAG: hypothetical protein NTW21_29900 [Verrucomicrobia bacterium]|nr:hypothetical protein [Verrucomicrobiota bacterium]
MVLPLVILTAEATAKRADFRTNVPPVTVVSPPEDRKDRRNNKQ